MIPSRLKEISFFSPHRTPVYCPLETVKGRISKNVLMGDTSLGMNGVSCGDNFKGGSAYLIVYVVAFIL